MNTKELKGNWQEQKAKIKQKFALSIDNELMCAENNKEEMFGLLKVELAKQNENCSRLLKPFNHILLTKKPLRIWQLSNQII